MLIISLIAVRITVGLTDNNKINQVKPSLDSRWRFFYAPKEVQTIGSQDK